MVSRTSLHDSGSDQWNGSQLEQRFKRGDETIAVAYVRARFLQRGGGSVSPHEIMMLAGLTPEAQPDDVPVAARNWNREFTSWVGAGQ